MNKRTIVVALAALLGTGALTQSAQAAWVNFTTGALGGLGFGVWTATQQSNTPQPNGTTNWVKARARSNSLPRRTEIQPTARNTTITLFSVSSSSWCIRASDGSSSLPTTADVFHNALTSVFSPTCPSGYTYSGGVGGVNAL